MQPGACATYYGTLWRNGWEKQKTITYDLTLEVLSVEQAADKTPRLWLRVSGMLTGDSKGYTETAYLKIDSRAWPSRLVIEEGFIEMTGCGLKPEERSPDQQATCSLVIPFDATTDLLAESAALDLPELRVSIHDFLTLFFGLNDLTAANATIRGVRANLAKHGQRKTALEDFNDGTGPKACYVVSSDSKFSIARRDKALFGFVDVNVNLPDHLIVDCVMRNESTVSVHSAESVSQEIARLRSLLVNPEELPRPAPEIPSPADSSFMRNFDLVSIADEPARAKWTGGINCGDREEWMTIDLRQLGTQHANVPSACCVELKVTSNLNSGLSHEEYARIWFETHGSSHTLPRNDLGRVWTLNNTRMRLLEDKGNDVEFRKDAQTTLTRRFQELPRADRLWIERLRTAARQPQSKEAIKKEWQDFSMYCSNW